VAGALTLGALAGALIAPAPPSSLASDSTVVTRLLALLAAEGAGSRAAVPAPTAATPATAPTGSARALAGHARAAARALATSTVATGAGTAAPSEGSSAERSAPAGAEESSGEKKPARLPPISHVWLVVLGGTGFAATTTAAAGYPYLTGTLLRQGTLLERYSAIEAYELAGDAALLTGGVGESVSTISQPSAATPSPAGNGQAETDAFLQRAVAPILASTAYGERGLVVITFGQAAQEQSLSETTLGATPPAGALLLSPALKAGAHSSEAFDSLAPRKSLEAIFAAP
jgi:hypothetical protein